VLIIFHLLAHSQPPQKRITPSPNEGTVREKEEMNKRGERMLCALIESISGNDEVVTTQSATAWSDYAVTSTNYSLYD
jgi:hypothetical protein